MSTFLNGDPNSTPSDGDGLVYDSTLNAYVPGAATGSGIRNVSGTVDLDDEPGIREAYATASATVEGVALAAGDAAVFRYFSGAWTYMIVGQHTTWQAAPGGGDPDPGDTPVTATADSGYVLQGTTSWTHTFPESPAGPTSPDYAETFTYADATDMDQKYTEVGNTQMYSSSASWASGSGFTAGTPAPVTGSRSLALSPGQAAGHVPLAGGAAHHLRDRGRLRPHRVRRSRPALHDQLPLLRQRELWHSHRGGRDTPRLLGRGRVRRHRRPPDRHRPPRTRRHRRPRLPQRHPRPHHHRSGRRGPEDCHRLRDCAVDNWRVRDTQ